MKKFLLFAGDTYYPSGGIDDLINSYDSIEEAEAEGRAHDWWTIVEYSTLAIVKQS